MASVNKVIIIGNLGQDPEVRYTPNGTAVVTISVATTRSWKNKESGEKQEETEWHRIVGYDRTAEIIGEYLKKGAPVYIEGRLKTRKWQDKEGIDKYTTEIIIEDMKMLGSRDRNGGDQGGTEPQQRSQGNQGNQQRSQGSSAPQQRGGQQRSQGNQQRPQQQSRTSTGFDDMDDDIPF